MLKIKLRFYLKQLANYFSLASYFSIVNILNSILTHTIKNKYNRNSTNFLIKNITCIFIRKVILAECK